MAAATPGGGRVRFDTKDLAKMAIQFGVETKVFQGDMLRAVGLGAIETQAAARINAPVFQGELAGGIMTRGPRIQARGERIQITDVVFATSPHALVVEEGRSPGKPFPPLGPIRRWVRLKVNRGALDISWTGKTGDAAIDSAAYLIAAKIHHKGIPATRFMDRAVIKGERRLSDALDDAVRRWERRLES